MCSRSFRSSSVVDRTPATFQRSFTARAITALIRGYQLAVSPLFPPSCRFYPSCSEYALEAVKIHGAWKGAALSFGRICRCNPWNAGGLDPVPETSRTNHNS
ncbi:MAG: membrane protein insertion efficiency factor YidD [Limnobacter sp.]